MNRNITRTVIVALIGAQCVLINVCIAATGKGNPCTVPWQVVADKIAQNYQLCSQLVPEKTRNVQNASDKQDRRHYAFTLGQPIAITIPSGIYYNPSLPDTEIRICKWTSGSWKSIRWAVCPIDSGSITIGDGIPEEGFFQLSYSLEDPDDRSYEVEAYVVVSKNWKKDLLFFCRNSRSAIESNRDPELIRSSMAGSHFDHTMDLISNSPVLTSDILQALKNAVIARQAFKKGEYPDPVIGGLTKIILERFPGAETAEFVLHVPADYDSARQWPLYVHVDPSRFAGGSYGERHRTEDFQYHKGMVDLWWHTVSATNLQWQEYKAVRNLIRSKLNIDEDRIYAIALCGNSRALMSLLLHYPDEWSHVDIDTHYAYCNLARNALNSSAKFAHGGHQYEYEVPLFDLAANFFEYAGCKGIEIYRTKASPIFGTSLPDAVKCHKPPRVYFTADSLQTAKAYWVQIDGREDENLLGTIDARADGQKIIIKTSNVDAYTLDLLAAPVNPNEPIEIIENGNSLGQAVAPVFTRRSEKYNNTRLIKNAHLSGPVWDAFAEPFVVVYGSSGSDEQYIQASQQVASLLAKGAPCFADKDVLEPSLVSHNLILIGSASSNIWLSKIEKQLPVRATKGRIHANRKIYDGDDIGSLLIYPNPTNPKKYVAVFFASTTRAMLRILDVYAEMKLTRPADVCIFEISKDNSIRYHVIEKFNTVWGWHDLWDKSVASVNKQYSAWRWRQWSGTVLRETLGVDVAIVPDFLRHSDQIPTGTLTVRDWHNKFCNAWILKITVKGYMLRRLLTSRFANRFERSEGPVSVEGVTLTKRGVTNQDGSLFISDIEKDKQYTVAIPDHLLRSLDFGMPLRNYDIVGEGYFVQLVQQYLSKKRNASLDSELGRATNNPL